MLKGRTVVIGRSALTKEQYFELEREWAEVMAYEQRTSYVGNSEWDEMFSRVEAARQAHPDWYAEYRELEDGQRLEVAKMPLNVFLRDDVPVIVITNTDWEESGRTCPHCGETTIFSQNYRGGAEFLWCRPCKGNTIVLHERPVECPVLVNHVPQPVVPHPRKASPSA